LARARFSNRRNSGGRGRGAPVCACRIRRTNAPASEGGHYKSIHKNTVRSDCATSADFPGELRLGIEEFAEDGGGVFAEKAIVGTKGSEEVGVDVEFTDDFAMDEDGDDDFGFGFEGAGKIAGIAGDVVNDEGHAATGGSAANALVERDAGVRRHGAFEGAEDEDIAAGFVFEHVEANPIVFGELAVKERDDVFHQGFGGSSGDGQAIQFEDETGRFRMSGGHDVQLNTSRAKRKFEMAAMAAGK
jgi:hypothetical protein